MNWRRRIRDIFESAVQEALCGVGLQSFEGFNSQLSHNGAENLVVDMAVYFSYQSIGGGTSTYLGQRDIQSAEYLPVTVSLRVVFRDFTDQAQLNAYEYADAICGAINGVKDRVVCGRIYKTGETEGDNYDGLYMYILTFGLNVFQVYDSNSRMVEVAASPNIEATIKS